MFTLIKVIFKKSIPGITFIEQILKSSMYDKMYYKNVHYQYF
jgi:hypothetical protein